MYIYIEYYVNIDSDIVYKQRQKQDDHLCWVDMEIFIV
jgi:hypothetical protein